MIGAAVELGHSSRRRGEVDAMDLVVGLILLVILPCIFYFGAGLLGLGAGKEAMHFREKMDVPPPPPDADEVQLRLSAARDLYMQNAKDFIAMQSAAEDQELQGKFLSWSLQCLNNAKSQLSELESLIMSDATASRTFAAKLSEVAELKRLIDADLTRVSQRDVLGVYTTP